MSFANCEVVQPFLFVFAWVGSGHFRSYFNEAKTAMKPLLLIFVTVAGLACACGATWRLLNFVAPSVLTPECGHYWDCERWCNRRFHVQSQFVYKYMAFCHRRLYHCGCALYKLNQSIPGLYDSQVGVIASEWKWKRKEIFSQDEFFPFLFMIFSTGILELTELLLLEKLSLQNFQLKVLFYPGKIRVPRSETVEVSPALKHSDFIIMF